MPERPTPEPELTSVKNVQAGSETDLGELAALFAAHSRGSVSPEVATDLALDIVLNEIVEQACEVTGATGAAIIVPRDGEMVCRASSGANSPEMGARLGSDAGLTAECIKTWKVQRCDDAYADARADVDASRSLGVRSVLVFPLVREGELSGLLEVFSSKAAAFGKQDELMLEALGQRVLKNMKRSREIFLPSGMGDRTQDAGLDAIGESGGQEKSILGSDMNRPEEEELFAESLSREPRDGFNPVTLALIAAIVVCAVLLATLLGMRGMARRSAASRQPVAPAAVAPFGEPSNIPETGNENSGGMPTPASIAAESRVATEMKIPPTNGITSTPADDQQQDGSLRVFENGKEVFRLPAEVPANARAENPAGRNGVQRASSVEAITPQAAGSVLERVEPQYPEQARQQKIQGPVVLEVHIGRDGAVEEVKLVSGQPVLADAAMAAVKQWRFKPRVEQGKAVEMQTMVTLNFRLPS